MMNNRAELLVNIARRAPWLLGGNEAFFPEIVDIDIRELIKDKDEHLTIICDNGQVYRQKLSLSIINDELKIDKPANWEDSSDSFHVFFRCPERGRYFFPITNAVSYPSVFSAPVPGTIYTLQRRRSRRIETTGNMSVIFRDETNVLNNAHIQNISVGGMMICESCTSDRYQMHSLIRDIFISVNTAYDRDTDTASRKIWPLISKGRIVRSIFNKEKSLAQYGIMFMHESSYVKETLNLLINGFTREQ
ncbi:MAG: hypothetical protein KKG47_16495 [Proteobacteria bacterium]|nr:hypothetical protein [Pseudomonadota bacterium]MBU1739657.1 hypothetical protein [Pseudomonadota bacterium]